MSKTDGDAERFESTVSEGTEAYTLMLQGRSLNAGDSFKEEALDLLTRAVRSDPSLTDASIELARCYQKKSDINSATNCLEDALKYCESGSPNKIVLRELSSCIRQKNCVSQEEKISNLLRSLELSKQALKLDLDDEENYYNLAKAYMCLFFATECVDLSLIYLSKTAYTKALSLSNDSFIGLNQSTVSDKTPITTGKNQEKFDLKSKPFTEQSDFLFNYSTVLIYLQEFQPALEYLRLAIKLDSEWREPRILEESLVDYLRQINAMLNELNKSNKRVVRRFSKLIETLKNVSAIEKIIVLDQQRFMKSNLVELFTWNLDNLKAQTITSEQFFENNTVDKINSEEIITVNALHLRFVYTVNYNQAMYLTFIAMDRNYSFVVVTIYNLAASRCPNARDIVTIIEPKIEEIIVKAQTSAYTDINVVFKRINVRAFKHLYVNGCRITKDQVSKPQFKVSLIA